MKTVNPNIERLPEILKHLPSGVPVVMVNLLKFRENARYPQGVDASPCTGREAYQRYSAVAVKKLAEVGSANSYSS